MSIQFDAPPQSRRELREREEQLRKAGATAEQAQRFAGETGVIDLSGAGQVLPIGEAVKEAPVDSVAFVEEGEAIEVSETSAAAEPVDVVTPTTGESDDLIAEEIEPVARPIESASVDDTADDDVNETDDAQTEAAPAEIVVDFEVVEVVEQIFSQAIPVQDSPSALPIEPSTTTGPIHWTEALAMPADLDPNDPASIADIPALSSDTNTIVLDDTPDIHEVSNQTGEIQLMVTGSILLPSDLTETGALAETIEAQAVDFSEDEIDEQPLSSLNPVSALSAVSASAETPKLIADAPKEKLSLAVIISLVAGGAAAIVLIALGVGALFHLF